MGYLFIYLCIFKFVSQCFVVYSACLLTPSVQFSSVTQSCLTLCEPMGCSLPGFPVLHRLPEFAQTHVHWVGDAIQPISSSVVRPLLLPSIFPCIHVFSNESALCIRWSKYWSFSISPSDEYSGLISFKMDWFDLLAVQGTLKSLLQYYSSKASILWCSVFVMVQFSHSYPTTGKTIAMTLRTFNWSERWSRAQLLQWL